MRLDSRFYINIIIVMTVLTTISIFGMIIRKTKLTQAKIMPEIKTMYLVPTDAQSMKELNLCPLFVKKKGSMDPEIIEDTIQILRFQNASETEIKEKIDEMTYPGRIYHVFDNGMFKEKQVTIDVPCIIPLGMFGAWNRNLIQLKTIDQGDLEQGVGLPDGLCAGHSLNNACIIRDYAESGEIKYLTYLNDRNGAAEFLLNLGIKNWLDVKEVKENLLKMSFDIDTSNLSAISTVVLFDSNLDKSPVFEVVDRDEYVSVQKNKEVIRKGLKQDYYVHVIIIGDEEVKMEKGHFFMFAIIKVLNEIQYVVIDTFPGGVYHLKKGSHEKDRLMFLIQNIEQGFSEIKLNNIKMKPEFMQSIGGDEESMREKMLIDERMEKPDEYNQIKQLNDLSKKLTQFGIEKYLSQIPQENLREYLRLIDELQNIFGEEFAYPELKKVITRRISQMK